MNIVTKIHLNILRHENKVLVSFNQPKSRRNNLFFEDFYYLEIDLR